MPPKIFLRFFRWFCHPKLKNSIEGDLMELYLERLNAHGKTRANINFTLDVILLFRPGIIRSANQFENVNHAGMFKNYFKIGIRNILKYKTFSFINVFGLAVAMSVCMLIILMLADQNRYDQFHEKKGREQKQKACLSLEYHTESSYLMNKLSAFCLMLSTQYSEF